MELEAHARCWKALGPWHKTRERRAQARCRMQGEPCTGLGSTALQSCTHPLCPPWPPLARSFMAATSRSRSSYICKGQRSKQEDESRFALPRIHALLTVLCYSGWQ